MKANEFNKVENYLKESKEKLEMLYEECDTSFKFPEWESETEIESWNKKLGETIAKIEILKMELIFIFKIEEDN